MPQANPGYSSTAPEAQPPASKAIGRLLIVLAAILVLGPVIYKEYPSEIARWHHAAARESWLDGHRDQALKKLTQALTWDPTNLNCLLSQADWLSQSEQYQESLACWHQVIKIQNSL